MAEEQSTGELICRRYEVTAKIIEVDGKPQIVRCPRCNVEVDFQAAKNMAGEDLIQTSLKEHQERMRRSFRGNKRIKYIPGKLHTPSGHFAFRPIDTQHAS